MWAARAGGLASLCLVACNVIFGVSDLHVDDAPAPTDEGGAGGHLGGGGGAGGAQGGAGGMVDKGGAGGTGGAAGAGGHGGGAPGFCDLRFGTLMNYTLCVDSQAFCIFYRTEPDTSCEQTCGHGGLECASADIEDPQMVCTSIGSVSCSDNNLTDVICACSKTCGLSGPCNPGEVCNNGLCI